MIPQNAYSYCKDDISKIENYKKAVNHSKLLKGKTWKVINGKRVWLSKEGK